MLKVGIVGLPNVGKSTLFKVLTKSPVDINNYPFCTIQPNVGIVPIKDKRLNQLSKLSNSQKTIEAVIEFVDIAGLVKGANQGEGLGNQFLANIREVDLICHVVRFFNSENIKHVEETTDPLRDIDIINTELILADLETVEKRELKLKKTARSQDQEAEEALNGIKKIKETLNQNQPAVKAKLNQEQEKLLKDLGLITKKPFIYCFNINESNNHKLLSQKNHPIHKEPHLIINTKLEEELMNLSQAEARELNLKSSLHILPQQAYKILGLITFFTTGEKESRAWTVKEGSTAPEAGEAVHSDFKEKFIKAEVINYEQFVKVQSYKKAKEKGLLRTEGKEYIVKDGDIIIFKI
ncbi:MAG: redox-regulated ATPase YchF [Candidatus Moranbacteria bacterium]|nr:redox-regulated ATPase YchF [Candidatus Moranbacteria bacterium]